jgi:hypothetical protein
MQGHKRTLLIQYAIGTPVVGVIYYILAIAFFSQMQFLADKGVRTVPWYYAIPELFVSFPFLAPSDHCVQFLRPIFAILGPLFGDTDAAAIFIIIGLQAVFWGFIVVFCFRFVSKVRACRKGPINT